MEKLRRSPGRAGSRPLNPRSKDAPMMTKTKTANEAQKTETPLDILRKLARSADSVSHYRYDTDNNDWLVPLDNYLTRAWAWCEHYQPEILPLVRAEMAAFYRSLKSVDELANEPERFSRQEKRSILTAHWQAHGAAYDLTMAPLPAVPRRPTPKQMAAAGATL